MANKNTKFRTMYTEIGTKEGKTYTEESKTDKSQAEDVDIYNCLKKYGITTLVNKTMATEPLYLDNTNRNMTLDEAVRQRKELTEYFTNQPARVRKAFGDSIDSFIEQYKMGQYGNMLDTGILTNEMVQILQDNKTEIQKETEKENTIDQETNKEV